MRKIKELISFCFALFLAFSMVYNVDAKSYLENFSQWECIEKSLIKDKIKLNKTIQVSGSIEDILCYDAYYLSLNKTKKIEVKNVLTVKGECFDDITTNAEIYIYKINKKYEIEKCVKKVCNKKNDSVGVRMWLPSGKYIIVFANFPSDYEGENEFDMEYYDEYVDGFYSGNDEVNFQRIYTVNDITDENEKIEISKKKLTLERLETEQLAVAGTAKTIKWTSSNKKVATIDKNGKVKALKPGKTTITAKVSGKKLKCIVTVKKMPINFTASLCEYNTRNNTFSVIIKNESKSKIRVYSSGAYSQDKDYTYYDRTLCLANNKEYIDIKPGKAKTVTFKVLGSITWPDADSHYVFFKFGFENKQYWGKVGTWSSRYSANKKKWIYTDIRER